jgi:hypothetical protein
MPSPPFLASPSGIAERSSSVLDRLVMFLVIPLAVLIHDIRLRRSIRRDRKG